MNYLFMKNFWFFSDDDCVLLAGGRYYFNRRLEVFGLAEIQFPMPIFQDYPKE